jgi:hypothetical protein
MSLPADGGNEEKIEFAGKIREATLVFSVCKSLKSWIPDRTLPG